MVTFSDLAFGPGTRPGVAFTAAWPVSCLHAAFVVSSVASNSPIVVICNCRSLPVCCSHAPGRLLVLGHSCCSILLLCTWSFTLVPVGQPICALVARYVAVRSSCMLLSFICHTFLPFCCISPCQVHLAAYLGDVGDPSPVVVQVAYAVTVSYHRGWGSAWEVGRVPGCLMVSVHCLSVRCTSVVASPLASVRDAHLHNVEGAVTGGIQRCRR